MPTTRQILDLLSRDELLGLFDDHNVIVSDRRVKSHLADCLEEITRAEREITLIRQYRTRLIADVVTGQLDVRAAAARLPAEAPDEPIAPDLYDDAEVDDADPDALDETDA